MMTLREWDFITAKTKVIWWFQAKAMTALWCLMPLHLTRFVAHFVLASIPTKALTLCLKQMD